MTRKKPETVLEQPAAPPPLETNSPPKILRAFRPNDIVFLECARMLSDDQMTLLHKQFKKMVPEVKVVILNAGVRIASRDESTVDESLEQYRTLAQTVREFLDHITASQSNPQHTENPRAELGLILAMRNALGGIAK